MFRALLLAPLLIPACADETSSGYAPRDAIYALSEIDGAAFTARATLSFPAKGKLAGEAPCNRYSGAQPAPYPWFEPGPIAATKRACPDLPAEVAYFKALAAMTLIEVAGDTLILSNDDGRQMVFRQTR